MTRSGFELVNDALFGELVRLEKVDHSDPEAMRAEIERARAVQGITSTIISNNRLVLEAAKAAQGTAESVRLPKMLTGAD